MPVMRTIKDHEVELSVDTEYELVDPQPFSFGRKRRRRGKTWGWECDCPVVQHGFASLALAERAAENWHNVDVSGPPV